jgi:hypothetical protein
VRILDEPLNRSSDQFTLHENRRSRLLGNACLRCDELQSQRPRTAVHKRPLRSVEEDVSLVTDATVG